jgi:alpha-mannosidase
MKLWDAERRLFDLLSASVQRFIPLQIWRLNGREVFLPIHIQAEPDRIYLLETRARVPPSDYKWFFKVVLGGNATLEVDDKLYGGIDDAHTYFPMEPGTRNIRMRVSIRRMFGYHDWSLCFRRAFLVEVYPRAFYLSLNLLSLLDYVRSLPSGDQLRMKLEETLFNALRDISVTPSIQQLTAALSLLYETVEGVPRGDIPRKYGDYSWLSGVYGAGVLAGKLRDISAVDINELREAIDRIEERILPVLDSLSKENTLSGEILALGHSHIDAAWLWPFRETREKVARTFSNMVQLLKRYNEAVYAQSSALYYEWIEEDYPDVFEEIKRLVKEGKWIPVGGMWIESDTQLVGGESLARQFLYGQRYFYSRFGRTCSIGWIPDSFGFAFSLPQLLLKSGLKVFVTHKPLWNDTNTFPYHSFLWKGVDGSTIPVQILLNSYNEMLTPNSIRDYWTKYKEKDSAPFIPYAYGYGDGGGGPTIEMLERFPFLSKIPGLPRIKPFSERDYLEKIEKVRDGLPVWNNELYVEYHRGTYTTNIPVKELMWRAEKNLYIAELIATASYLKTREDYARRLERIWKTVLLNQFHDVLPGSSIMEVYDEATRELTRAIQELADITKEGLQSLTNGGSGNVGFFNPLPWGRKAIVSVPRHLQPRGARCQDNGKELLVEVELPAAGYRSMEIGESKCESRGSIIVEEKDDGVLVNNGVLELFVASNGEIKYLKLVPSDREILSYPSNSLRIHVDKPGVFDAWELTDDFLTQWEDTVTVSKPRIVSNGPLQACIEYEKSYKKSRIKQTICVYDSSPVVEVKTRLEWYDKGYLLKAWFKPSFKPLRAVFETPYGVVERSPSWKTSWDKAKFESPALRWVDISNGEVGFAVISPSRHGYSVSEEAVSLSLIKSPLFPNPWSDLGEFEFTYYIYPHLGGYEEARVPFVSSEVLYDPVIFDTGFPAGMAESFIEIEPPEVLLGAFKKSEDGDGLVIRLYNPQSRKVKTRVKLNAVFREAVEVDIPELNSLGKIETRDGEILVEMAPYEVKTIKLLK